MRIFRSQARFIMSTDTELTGTGVGNVTGISYFADFEAYKKILILSHDSSSAIIHLYRIWDARLFPNFLLAPDSEEEPQDLTNGNGNDDEEISQFLRQLHFQESPSHQHLPSRSAVHTPNRIVSQSPGNQIQPAPATPCPLSSSSITSASNTGATALDSQGTEHIEAVQGNDLTEPIKPPPRGGRAATMRKVAAAAPGSINSIESVVPIAGNTDAEQAQKRTTRGKKGTTKRR